jgi:LysM repeat protein
MTKSLRTLLYVGLFWASLAMACGLSTTPPTEIPVAQPTSPPEAGARTATIGEIVNIVEARESAEGTFAQVENGLVLEVGGQLRTGAASRTRIDFSEGTIVRLGENSILAVEANTSAGGDPFTSFSLEVGKLWASLTGGSLEVDTPIGVATVRGSYAFFEYNPGDPNDLSDDVLTLNCLEGSCRAENQTVDERLGNLEQIVLTGGGQQFTRGRLGFDAVEDFVNNNPEVGQALVATLIAAPPATATPETPTPLSPTGVLIPTDTTVPLPTPTLPPVTVAPSVPLLGRHTLENGETLFCIGRAYGVLPNAIAQANNIDLNAGVQFGQVLAIPAVQWVNIPPGPVCPPQFESPFPGLPVSTDTPVATDTPSITATPTASATPQPVCEPPEFFDPFLNRCRLPDPTPYSYGAQLIDSPLYQALAKNQRVLPISTVSALLTVAGAVAMVWGNRRRKLK